MFDLKGKVQNKMNSKYWSRGASVYSYGKVGEIFIDEDIESIIFSTDVESSDLLEEYNVDITIRKTDDQISYSCDCMAYGIGKGCKHIAGLARGIEKDYVITDDLKVFNKKTGENELLSSYQNTGEDDYSNESEKDFSNMSEREIYQELLINDDFLRNMMISAGLPVEGMSGEIFNHLKKEFLETSRKALNIEKSSFFDNLDRKPDNLDIFNKLEDKYDNTEKEDLFKVKLEFTQNSYYEDLDLKMNVFRCKTLKNGKLSTGTIVNRQALNYRGLPKRIEKIKLFIDERGDYYNPGNNGITYLNSPEYFLENLFNLDEVFDMKNNILNIIKNIYELKISVKKDAKSNFEISLVLEGTEKGDIFFKDFKIVGKKGFNFFACLRINKDLLFFKSDLSYDFITELNSSTLILNENEFNELKKSKYFNEIIKHSYKIEDLGMETILGTAKGKIIIDIDDEFEKVKVYICVNYGDNNISLEDLNKSDIIVSDDNNFIKRNINEEKDIFDKLSNLEKLSEIKTDFGFIKIVNDDINDFFDEVEKLIENNFIVEYAQKTKRISNKELGINVNVKSGIDFFDINTTLTIGDKEIEECSELLDLIAKSKHKKSVTLKNGMTVLLKNDLEKSLDLLEDIGVEKKDIGNNIEISKHNIGLLKTKKTKNNILNFELDKETLKLKKSLSNFSGIRKMKIPENINATLRDYQHIGYNWMTFLEKYNFSGFLADDMGLGKTLQTLTLLQKLYNNKLKTRSLVVCPTSLVFNWLDESKKFTPDLKVEYIKDGKAAFTDIKKDTQLIIVSYGIIANLSEGGYLKEKFHYLILDEAQNIKNPNAKRTKSICKIVSKYRLALSGTPIENNLMELWSGFNFLMPGFLNNLNNFKNKYMGASSDKDALKNLSSKVKPFILRRKKEDVLKELPEKVEEIIKLEMGTKQKAFYQKLKNAFKLQITKELKEQGLNKSRFMVLDSLLKLRQACLTPELIPGDGNITNESVKLDYIRNSIGEMLNNGHNLLIFSQFTGFLKYIKDILEEKNIEYNYLDGQTRAKDRKGLVDEFNNGNKQVFIISLKAGGTGLNLTKADYVIHLDPWWNPAVENQATDRAHRMGQKKTVFVQKLICKDSIEEKIIELQEKKKKLIDDVFSGNFSGSLSKEDIDFIFE